MSLLSDFEKTYAELDGEGIDQFWIDYSKHLEKQLTWRSVEDEMPEKEQAVLGIFDIGNGLCCEPFKFSSDVDDELNKGIGVPLGTEWALWMNTSGFLSDEVTHWLPIPKLDKEDVCV